LGEEVEVRQFNVQGRDVSNNLIHNGREEVGDILGDLLDSKVEVKMGLDLFGDIDMSTNNNNNNNNNGLNRNSNSLDQVVYKFSLVPSQQCVARTAKSAKGLINNVEIS